MTNIIKRCGKRGGGAGGEEKNHIKRRVERQKVFSSPPAINQSSFITQPFKTAVRRSVRIWAWAAGQGAEL